MRCVTLRYQPETIDQKPSQVARDELNMTITRKAAEIMVKESTRAYHDPSLRLSLTGLDIPYLTTDFGLKVTMGGPPPQPSSYWTFRPGVEEDSYGKSPLR